MKRTRSRTTEHSARSLRTLTLASAVALCLLMTGLVIALLSSSRSVWRSAQTITPSVQALVITEEIDRALHDHDRLSEIWIATRDPRLEATEASFEPTIQRLLQQMAYHIGSAREARVLADLSINTQAYFAESKAVASHDASIEDRIRTIHPLLDRALASNTSLQKINTEDLRQAQWQVGSTLRLQILLAIVALVVLAIGLATVAAGVRELILHPVFDLQEAMKRFRGGDLEARAALGTLNEMRDLAAGFNDMAATIAQRRRDQLVFLAAIAHDLRNPLAALKLAVQSLARDPANFTPQRHKRLDTQIDRLARMVGDLLDATRIEAGQLELTPEEFDLRNAAQAMVDLYAPTTTTHRLVLKTPARPIVIRGDALRVEQVVSNLLSNAIRYSPNGGRVEVSVAEVAGEAELSVSDQGIGISPEEIPNLFLPFHRRPSPAESAPGVGLGLSIVRRIVSAHGGSIQVDSVPKSGSTFRVRLPLAAQHHREVESPRSGEPEPEPARPDPR